MNDRNDRTDRMSGDPAAFPAILRRTPSWLMGQLAAHAQRLVGERLDALGVRRHHYSALSALAEFGPMSQMDLGRHTHLDRSDVTAVMTELEAKGLISRAPDPADRRRNVVAVTDEGLAFRDEMGKLIAEAQDELLAPLNGEERAGFTASLAQVVGYHAKRKGSDSDSGSNSDSDSAEGTGKD